MKYYIEDVFNEKEFELDVDYDYQPHEPQSRHYPGCDAQIDICEVRMSDGTEICLMPQEADLFEMQALENEWADETERLEYKKYGYMLD